ncbi:MAG: outer membrane beta-barrel protein [Bacteroidales bacterium]|nr:outer membrane beta-barrel protein [Bacteroidales bacterium]
MKKFIYILSAAVALTLFSANADAQMGKRYYVNGGWQFNGTLDNEVVQSGQGYGAYIEGGYYLTPMLAVGGFASFNTNNQYFPKQTYVFDDKSALTTDLNKSIYQVPFGTSVRYRFSRSMFQPYIEAKLGTEYSTQSTYMSTFVSRDSNWGFYVSPEVGVTVYPFNKDDFGFQLAAYYSYSTNESNKYSMKGINNLGFKLGIAF